MFESLTFKVLVGLHTLHLPGACNDTTCYQFNTDNELFAVQIENVILGRMKNSYNLDSAVFGYADSYRWNKWAVNYGAVLVTNYPEDVLPWEKGYPYFDLDNRQTLALPYFGTSYYATEFISVETTFQGSAFNLGVAAHF